ncbi:MAG: T9SS type A sorting domain-containing protein [Crocinitomicaceae bacterium]|nr:T9SS type A sorting domain-containing protein [Crocinitomicaceae bacterium]
MKKVLFILTLALTPVFGQTTKRAIFLGNSYTAFNNLPNLVSECATSTGDELIYSSNTPGGYTLEGHSTNATSQSLIKSTEWDYLILQDQSQRPSFPDAQVAVEVFPFAEALNDTFKLYNERGQTLFYMTWGRQNGDAGNCPVWPPVCTYEGMDSLLNLRYRTMAADNEAEVSPVGAVWRYIRENHPSIDLYTADESHPSAAGSYVAAVTFYTAIFKKDPTLITYDFTLSAEDAEDIREAAKVIVFDDMLEWHIGEYDVTPAWSVTYDTGYTYDFTNESLNSTSVEWEIDGTVYTTDNPTHTFPSDGYFDVILTAMNESDTIVLIDSVAIAAAGLNQIDDMNISIFPNPVENDLYISFGEPVNGTVILFSVDGKILFEQVAEQQTIIEVDFLSPGPYLIAYMEENGTVVKRQFIKE